MLLCKSVVACLNDLTLEERFIFLVDMTIIGDALTQVYNPLKINYDVLGNAENFYMHMYSQDMRGKSQNIGLNLCGFILEQIGPILLISFRKKNFKTSE